MKAATKQADRVSAAVFFGLGLAMAIGGWRMDRLEIRQIHPASIPGLVPMILGAALACSAVLLYAGAGQGKDEEEEPGNWRAMIAAAGLSVCYAFVLVGTLPFWLATAFYIAAFVAVFSWNPGRSRGAQLAALARAVLFAALAAGAVSALFRYGFLVRLP